MPLQCGIRTQAPSLVQFSARGAKLYAAVNPSPLTLNPQEALLAEGFQTNINSK